MDVRTGEITEDAKKILKNFQHMLEINSMDMTKKQKKNKQVSLKDHKSKLGKKLTEERKKRGYSEMTRNQKRNLRNKLKG